MIHEILPVGALQCNCSIFGDEGTREAIVVDPGDDIEVIEEILRRHGLTVKAIFITHAHIDHIGGAQKLKLRTGAPVYMHEKDQILNERLHTQAAWLGMHPPDRAEVDVYAQEGDTLQLGGATFHVLHTPGHTQGSLCLWIPEQTKLIAGDTIFHESIGRTDLPGGDSRQILASIHHKLYALPEETQVIPGHGAATTIAHEKRYNPFTRMTP